MKVPIKPNSSQKSPATNKSKKTENYELLKQRMLADVLGKIQLPVLIVDSTQKIIYFNEAAEKFLNISKEVINKKYSKIIKRGKSLKEAIKDLLQNGKRIKKVQLKYENEDVFFVETFLRKLKLPGKNKWYVVFELHPEQKIEGKEKFQDEDGKTRSKAQTKKIIEREKSFRALIENSRDVIMRFDRNFKHIYVNSEIERQLGISPKDMIGKTHRELGFPEELVEKWEPGLKKVFDTGKENRMEFQLPNGIWIDWLMVPEFDENGKVKYVITSARDITKIKQYEDEIVELNKKLKQKISEQTQKLKEQNAKLSSEIKERKREEERLSKNEKKFRDLFELSASGIVVIDIDGKILETNRRFCKIIGYSKEELLKMSVFDITYPGAEYEAKKNLSLLRQGKLLHHTVKDVTKFNEVVFLELYEKMIEDENGNERIFITINDITDRIKGERELVQKDIMYKSLFDYSPNGIILENSEGDILAVNDSLCKSLGYSKEELIGKHISILAPEEDEEFVLNNIRSIMSGRVLQHRVKSRKKDCTFRMFDLSEIKIPLGSEEEGILVIARDISDVVEREKNLIKAKEAAEKAMKFKTEFLAQISHEIRSPINLVLSYINLLKEDLGDNLTELQEVSFNGIESAGQRILKTIESVLNVSEMEAGLYEPKFNKVDFNTILTKLNLEYSHYAEIRGLGFVFEKNAEETDVLVDEYSAAQIISNLLDNAIKYTKEGKVILRTFNEESFLKVQVEDTGIGISKEFLPKLFEAFEQEDSGDERRYEGTGLGLALVKKYCEVNKATIEVESEKNVGSKFTVAFNKSL